MMSPQWTRWQKRDDDNKLISRTWLRYKRFFEDPRNYTNSTVLNLLSTVWLCDMLTL
jgi:hypothetical protein